MLIDTAVFGPVDVMESALIHMPHGPYGFDEHKTFALLEQEDEGVMFRWLQSTDGQAPCFVIFDPAEIVTGYAPQVEPSDLRTLGCRDVSELKFYVIAVIPEDYTKATVNLKSPIALNAKTNTAIQVILSNPDYSIRFPLAGNFKEAQ